ncbi:MAG: trypsin-like peptidase domain-containing protein [Clostridia bacterium]|nr:trypsin-like peptidase domain-containing protein [Clostridia bacterium]
MMKDYENENLMPENDGNETESALPTDESDTGSEEVSLSETAEEILKKAGETVLEAAEEEEQPEKTAESASTPEPAEFARPAQPQETPAVFPQAIPGSTYTPEPQSAAPTRPAMEPTPVQTAAQNTYNPYGTPTAPGQPVQPQPQTRPAWSPYPAGTYVPGANGNHPYQGQTYNAYAARTQAPTSGSAGSVPGSTGISYAPAKKKDKKSSHVGAIAAICAGCVLFSGLFGFGGTLLANRINGSRTVGSTLTEQHTASSPSASSGDTVVIYKSVDDVVTSTAATAGSDLNYAQVAALVKDSVVEIVTEYTTRNSWFQYTTGGAGSGVIISEDGYLITNAHVILDNNMQNVADTVTVRLTSGDEYTAEVIRYDTDEDIAILKVNASGLVPVRCGDSDKLVVGEELIIVGNPLGELGGSVSNGIVSATEREIQVGGVTMHLIQTNAAVNPGNSGGGMFNMKGELVGIVNAKSSGSGIEGLGFAIPINQALSVSEQLLNYGYVRGKPMIGVSFEDVSGSNYFFYYSVKAGVYVRSLVEGMNDKVLKEGDRIIAVNGEEISSSEDIKAIVYASSIGDKLTFQLYRDNKLMEVEVTCYERTPDASDSSISFGTQEIPGSLDDFFGGR